MADLITRADLLERWTTAVTGNDGSEFKNLDCRLAVAVIQAAAIEYAARGERTANFYMVEDHRE